ncbi:ribonuclease Z [Kribbella sandramycini]|uniref:Ribonuclease Z n=1 Tax=Kribbella sandramycini TaxID=60450 RepID=A0A7Y4P3S4_9ACTN|nr:ribonuclease Z [Kribbella sandramycini]MBB6571762.1 ribonuclease Z [Kribbella sandramycini]NOL44405.1 ribonuclease Z [Kribbella sandramycini]
MRELVVLGTGSQVPSRERTQNGYFLRWDDEGFLFDPGEGTQRQMLYAGVPAGAITRLCITHFHGDHCLGVPGVIQRMSLDDVPHAVRVHYPASGQEYFDRLHYAASFYERTELLEEPVEEDGLLAVGSFGQLWARRLEHSVESFGYQLIEPDGRRMLPEKLRAYGVAGPDIARLQRAGSIDVDGRTVHIDEVSAPRPGQRFAFVMDTRLCANVLKLADRADLLVIESTYLSAGRELAHRFGHLTAQQAARVAAECGVRKLVLTHFSQRYLEPERFHEEAAAEFDGEIVVAADLTRTAVPARSPS